MAAGDILSAEVLSDGWTLKVKIEGVGTGGTYDMGLGTDGDPENAKVVLTATSKAFGADTNATTVVRTIYGTKERRQAYPNEASNEESVSGSDVFVQIALSDYVYAKDKVGVGNSGTDPTVTIASGFYTQGGTPSNSTTDLAVTNSSTHAYPTCAGTQWDPIAGTRGFSRVKSAFPLAANCFHIGGIAAVRFDLDGQTSANNEYEIVTAETTHQRSLTGLYATAYKTGDFSLTGFTQGEQIDARFRVYPALGDVVFDTNDLTLASEILTDEVRGCTRIEYTCDKNDTIDVIKYISTTGNDTTGDGSSGNPYLTIQKCLDVGANVIKCKAGTHAAVGGSPGAVTFPYWVVIEPEAGQSKSTVTIQMDATYRTPNVNRLSYQDVKVTLATTASGLWPLNDGEKAWFYDCNFDNTVGTALVPFYGYHCVFFDLCDGDLCKDQWYLATYGSTYRSAWSFDGCNLAQAGTSAGVIEPTYRVVACACDQSIQFHDKEAANPSPNEDNLLIAFNTFMNFKVAGASCVRYGMVTSISDLAFIGNVMERSGAADGPLFEVAGNNTATPVDNVLIWLNTVVGARSNLCYNWNGAETTVAYRRGWSMKGNLHRDYNLKTDTHVTASGNRIGNWAGLFGVCCGYDVWDYAINPSDNAENDGFAGPFTLSGATEGEVTMDWVDDNSYATGDGTGNGDYHTDNASGVDRSRVKEILVAYDLEGTVRIVNGSAGAYEMQTSAAPSMDSWFPGIEQPMLFSPEVIPY